MLDGPEKYDESWAELNRTLRRAEAGLGLGGAIAALEENQRATGFIKDSLLEVERHVFRHPDDPERFFRVQFNAKRRQRFNGAGVTAPPEGVEILNGGCFLCRENVRWQQQGAELGYEIDLDGREYLAWMNPFPLMPGHVVLASVKHETQDWSHGPHGGLEVRNLVNDLVGLAARMPGFVGFHNGVDAGASIAGHLHFQFFQRPEDIPLFPLEAHLAAASGDRGKAGAPTIFGDYPVPVVACTGAPLSVAETMTGWIDDWAKRNADRIHRLTANIIAFADGDGAVTVLFIPRDRAKSRGAGMSGLVGGLEVLGEVVFSSVEERDRLDSGDIDYFAIEKILASVRTPLFTD